MLEEIFSKNGFVMGSPQFNMLMVFRKDDEMSFKCESPKYMNEVFPFNVFIKKIDDVIVLTFDNINRPVHCDGELLHCLVSACEVFHYNRYVLKNTLTFEEIIDQDEDAEDVSFEEAAKRQIEEMLK